MSNCNWELIDGFYSPSEFHRFESWMDKQVQSHMAQKIKVQNHYFSAHDREKWFKCTLSGEIWRLVPPDFPFRGYWGKVDDFNSPVELLESGGS